MLGNYGNLISDGYRRLLAERYSAELFSGATAERVNAWVREKTAGNIDRIVNELPEQTAMVLVNAIYFNSAWLAQFFESQTEDAPFHLSPATQIMTPFMHQIARFSVLTRPGYRAIRLPYANESLAMVIVLPDGIAGLPAVAESLMGEKAAKLLSAFASETPRRVELALPRFKLNADLELTPLLNGLGLRIACSDAADFSGVTGSPANQNGIKIGRVRHKAVIEVMEKGTEAAAASVEISFAKGIMRPEPNPEPFIADRPFMFFIADKETGAVLFQGRVADPSQQA
jgi:serpin B